MMKIKKNQLKRKIKKKPESIQVNPSNPQPEL
jgi:hypothetical protein